MDAPLEVVWEAITDPDQRAVWWPEFDDLPATAEVELVLVPESPERTVVTVIERAPAPVRAPTVEACLSA